MKTIYWALLRIAALEMLSNDLLWPMNYNHSFQFDRLMQIQNVCKTRKNSSAGKKIEETERKTSERVKASEKQ